MKLTCIKKLGSGSYGTAYQAKDENGELYTVKFFMYDKRSIPESITGHLNLREVDFLVSYKHRNINSAKEIMIKHPFRIELKENMLLDRYCAVYNYAEHDLDHYITYTTKRDIKNLMYQILSGIYFLHTYNIMHRDLKPGNILFFKDGSVKITDFGLSKFDSYVNKTNTINIGTYGFMSLDVLKNDGLYDKSADIWSCGSILLNMLKGSPFFNTNDQASFVSDVVRKITDTRLFNMSDIIFENKMKKFIMILKSMKYQIEDFDNLCDLLDNMMTLDPKRRYKAYQCLIHPYFNKITCMKQDELCIEYGIHSRLKSKERTKSISIFTNYLANNTNQDHRIIFQALNIFDRLLMKEAHKIYEMKILAYISIYIAYKYFKTHDIKSMREILSINSTLSTNYLNKLEDDMIKTYLKFEIYRPTIYDIVYVKRIGIENVKKIFDVIANNDQLIGYNLMRIADILKELLTKK